MSVKITLKLKDGTQQTFIRTVETRFGDSTTASELSGLRTQMGQLQTELNNALTVQVEKEKAATAAIGTSEQNQRDSEREEEEEVEDNDEEENDDDDKEQNGSEPPQKIKKTS